MGMSSSTQGNQQPSNGSSEMCRNPINQVSWTARKSIANVNENYLRNSKRSDRLGMFDQVYARKKHCKKVVKVIEILKKKALKQPRKKYNGFGEEVDQKKGLPRKKKERKLKKAQVSEEEAKLMKELMVIGESAVAEASRKSVSDVSQANCLTSADTALIEELEEFHTFAQVDSDTLDFDTLLEL